MADTSKIPPERIDVDWDNIGGVDISGKADKSMFQVVSILPVEPKPDTFYFIVEE